MPDSIPLDAPDFSERAVIESRRPHMPNDRDERHVRNMIGYCDKVLNWARQLTRETFFTDEARQYGIVMAAAQIGEQANRVTDEFQADHPEIPWREIVDFRNKALHDYEHLSMEQIWDEIISLNIPRLKDQMEDLL
jgi:uncharacterized protein with HEPN domain